MRALLIITAIVEAGAGVALLAVPSTLARLLVGGPLDTPAASAIGRIEGAALIALAAACWSARDDVASRATRGIVAAMLLYNCGAIAVLLHAAISGVPGIGLLLTAAVHAGLAVACLLCLAGSRNAVPGMPAAERE
jgi:hypothetical protein